MRRWHCVSAAVFPWGTFINSGSVRSWASRISAWKKGCSSGTEKSEKKFCSHTRQKWVKLEAWGLLNKYVTSLLFKTCALTLANDWRDQYIPLSDVIESSALLQAWSSRCLTRNLIESSEGPYPEKRRASELDWVLCNCNPPLIRLQSWS